MDADNTDLSTLLLIACWVVISAFVYFVIDRCLAQSKKVTEAEQAFELEEHQSTNQGELDGKFTS